MILSETNRISFLSALIDLYYLMVSLCLKMDKLREAFEYAEKGKSRAFLELLESVHVDPKEASDKDLVARAEALRFLINHLYKQLESAPRDVDVKDNRNPSFKEILNKIRDSEQEVELWGKIRSQNPEYASLRITEIINLEEVQRLLDEHSALIEYYYRRGGKNPIIVFLVAKSSLLCVQFKLSVIDLWNMIFDHTTGKILEPSRENLAIQKIYFCLHGLLHLFPLHAMYKETEYGRRYVIEDYAVAYTPAPRF